MIFNLRGDADVLIRLALMTAPLERQEWAEAMRAEAAHLPDECAYSFAAGCLWATIQARVCSPAFILGFTQWALVMSAMGWSVASLWLAEKLAFSGAGAPATVAYASAAMYFAGSLLTALLGLRATVILVTPVLVLMTLTAAATKIVLPPSPYTSLYQALALEQCALLILVLLIARGVPGWVARRDGSGR